MNKVAIIILTLILAMAVGLSGCVTIKLPGAEEPMLPSEEPAGVAPPTAEAPPAPELDPWQSAIEVIQLPREARVGEYITVQIRVPKWDPVDPNRLWVWNEYALSLRRDYTTAKVEGTPCEWDLGYAEPDDQNIVCWYVAIPPTWTDWSPEEGYKEHPFPVGNYQWVILGAENGGHPLVERNIIIKE